MNKFTVQDLGSKELKNFFNIFGFVKVSGFFDEEMKDISFNFNELMSKKFGKKKKRKRNYFYPQFIEHNKYLTSLLEKDKIKFLVENLLGQDPIFTGSDGNIFAGSTPWHRDYLIKQRSVKMLCYLESVNDKTGALRVIPGSHFTEDRFSNFLGDGLTWPEPPIEGGFDEKGFFGKGNKPTVFGQNNLIPNYVIDSEPGDIVVFNHNIIHCSNFASKFSILPSKIGFRKKRVRRMFGMHFFSHPKNIKDSVTRKEVESHTEAIFRAELREFKKTYRFGPCIKESNSSRVKNFTSFFDDLRIEDQIDDYDGIHDFSSNETIDLHNKIKSFKYNPNLDLN